MSPFGAPPSPRQDILEPAEALPLSMPPQVPSFLPDFEEAHCDQAEEAARKVDDARAAETIRARLRRNPTEAGESWIDKMEVDGFETTQDVKIPDAIVRRFLGEAIGEKALKKAKINGVIKTDRLNLHVPADFREDPKNTALFNRWFKERKLLGINMLGFDREEDYSEAAMVLEGGDDPRKLSHVYNIRALGETSIGHDTKRNIRLDNFRLSQSKDFDFMDDLDLATEDDRMRAVMLGVAAHEWVHFYLDRKEIGVNGIQGLPREAIAEYQDIIAKETSPRRRQFVSDYVLRHKEVYQRPFPGEDDTIRQFNEAVLFEEDLADSVRIYVTNSKYLREHYPRRLAFIQKYLPFLKPDTVVPAVKQIQQLH